MKKVTAEKNVPNWVANEDDYELVFCIVDGLWIESGHNIDKYKNMLLCDYLSLMQIIVPDYTQFMRIMHPDYILEYRANGGRVRIDYNKRVSY